MTASNPPSAPPLDAAASLYLELLKRTLTRFDLGMDAQPLEFPLDHWKRPLFEPIRRFLRGRGYEIVHRIAFDPRLRTEGRDWPRDAETMIGLKRLDNVQACVADVIERGVPGDFIETGAWRGGASIFMRACLAAYGDTTRTVWVADSFQGLPRPDAERYPADANDPHWSFGELAVSLEQVKANFAKYGMLDDRVRFLPGWFKDTLPTAPVERLAVARLDGDMYESTLDALVPLYPKLSPGGYLIVDDYGGIPACRKAVDDYRASHGITEPIQPVDWTGVYWQRTR